MIMIKNFKSSSASSIIHQSLLFSVPYNQLCKLLLYAIALMIITAESFLTRCASLQTIPNKYIFQESYKTGVLSKLSIVI